MDSERQAYERGRKDRAAKKPFSNPYPVTSELSVHYIFGFDGVAWALDDYDLME